MGVLVNLGKRRKTTLSLQSPGGTPTGMFKLSTQGETRKG